MACGAEEQEIAVGHRENAKGGNIGGRIDQRGARGGVGEIMGENGGGCWWTAAIDLGENGRAAMGIT